jgi:hypothetical protein
MRTPTTRIHKYKGESCSQIVQAGDHLVEIVLAVLREIFDESAYARFLARTGTVRSAASYRRFLCDREEAVARRPRCC